MPFNFSAIPQQWVAKPGVVSDGEVITVSSTDGYSVVSTLSSYSAFKANPKRSAVGKWSVTMKDSAYKVLDLHVATMLDDGYYLATQLQPTTIDSNGNLVLHWVFNVAGTPTDLPTTDVGVNHQFLVYVEYSETSVS